MRLSNGFVIDKEKGYFRTLDVGDRTGQVTFLGATVTDN